MVILEGHSKVIEESTTSQTSGTSQAGRRLWEFHPIVDRQELPIAPAGLSSNCRL
ncbi:MAG TPA: hypothetical protein V6D48_21100 [Oculatellaceae cyanobacterium]